MDRCAHKKRALKMIRVSGMTKKFGHITAVDNIDLDLHSPGLIGFLGPNGAGKTTTMRMLTGALPMTAGVATVAGFDVFDQPLEVKARVGYLPESPPVYPDLSVGEYLKFVAQIRGIPRAQRLAAVGGAMERVGLTGWEGRLCGALSKGYRQRVGLAQALVHNPPVLILDEPTAGLDPAQLVGLRSMIRNLASERLVLLSTHILTEVEALCERVVLINAGNIVGDGTVESLALSVGVHRWVDCQVKGAGEDGAKKVAELDCVQSVEELDKPEQAIRRYRITGTPDLIGELARLVQREEWTLCGAIWRNPVLEEVFLSLVEAER